MKKNSAKKHDVLTAVESMPTTAVNAKVEVKDEETGTTETVTTKVEAPTVVIPGKKMTKVIVDGTEVEMPLGRPVDPTSARQIKLAEMEKKRAAGELKRGRPAVPGSAAATKRAEMEAKKATPGYEPKRGRPTDPSSPRQLELQKKEARRKERLAALGLLPTTITADVPAEASEEAVAANSSEVSAVA